LAVLAPVELGIVASLSASIWSSNGAKLPIINANVRVLVIDLTIANSYWDELTIVASILARVEAGVAAWLVAGSAQDWAEKVVVLRVASVSFWVVGLRTAVENTALLDWLRNWGGSNESDEGSESESEVLHFEIEGND
jgi:hypothetical protein